MGRRKQGSEQIQLQYGGVRMCGQLRGAHVCVEVRGHGQEGQQPLLGRLVMDPAEWSDMKRHALVIGDEKRGMVQAPLDVGRLLEMTGNLDAGSIQILIDEIYADKQRCTSLFCLFIPMVAGALSPPDDWKEYSELVRRALES